MIAQFPDLRCGGDSHALAPGPPDLTTDQRRLVERPPRADGRLSRARRRARGIFAGWLVVERAAALPFVEVSRGIALKSPTLCKAVGARQAGGNGGGNDGNRAKTVCSLTTTLTTTSPSKDSRGHTSTTF
jgi:hypothetical protein